MNITSNDLNYHFPFTVAPTTLLATGATTQLNTPTFIVSTATGANKLAEYGLIFTDNDNFYELKLDPNTNITSTQDTLVCRTGAFLGIFTIHTNLTATQYVGLEIGSFGQNPPFPTTAISGALAQLRWVASTDSWELYCNAGDGITPPVVTKLQNVTGIYTLDNVPHGVYAEIEWDPFKREVRAFINGVLGARYSGVAFPDVGAFGVAQNSGHAPHAAFFLTSGTNAAGSTSLFINNFNHTLVDAKGLGYTLRGSTI